MTGEWLVEAVRNNAEWCDAVCRSHGAPGRFGPRSWTSTAAVPPYYPDAITLSPDATFADLAGGVEGKGGASVKDSFAVLSPDGWEQLFEARWIHRPPPEPPRESGALHWEPVRDARTLREWELACFGGETDELLKPSLLRTPGIAVLAGRARGDAGDLGDPGDILCGSVLNVSGRVTGVSNVFGHDLDAAWAGTVAGAAALFPGRPLVGYETDTAPAARHGFTPIGPLRVWLKN